MQHDEETLAWKLRGGQNKPVRLTIVDSRGVEDSPRYSKMDPMLINPYMLLILQSNRFHLVRGTNLNKIAERLRDEAVTVIQPCKKQADDEAAIDSITLHWLYEQTLEEFLKEIVAKKERRKPGLETARKFTPETVN